MARRWRTRSTTRRWRLTDLAGITERRIDRLLNPDINEGLPAFLSTDPGLSSGFMIAQIVAAALINECQVLSHPSSTGSIPTDGGKEDHVSMGMTGRAQAAPDCRECRARCGHRADVCRAGTGVPQAAAAQPGD